MTAASLARDRGQAAARAGDRRGRGERLACRRPSEIQTAPVAPSRRCARGAPREALALYRQAARARQDRGAPLRGLARRRRRRPTWRSAASARRATCCWRCGRYAEAQRHFPVDGAAARVGVLRVAAGPARRGGARASRRRATRRWPRSSWRRPGAGGGGAPRVGARAARRAARRAALRDRARALQPGRGAAAHRRSRGRPARARRPRRACWRWSPTTSRPRGETRARLRLLQRAAAAGQGHRVVRDRRRGLPEHDPASSPTDDRARPSSTTTTSSRYAVEQQGVVRGGDGWRARSAEYSLQAGLAYDRHYLERAAELWIETARANQAANGPVDLSANAFHAGDRRRDRRWAIWRWRADLRRARGAAAARRRGGGATGRWRGATRPSRPRRLPAPAFPAVLRRQRELPGHLARGPRRVGAGRRSGRGAGPADRRRRPTAPIFTRPGAARAADVRAIPASRSTSLPARRRAGGGGRAGAGLRGAARRSSACSSTRRPRCARRSCAGAAQGVDAAQLRPGAQGAGRSGAGGRRCGAALLRKTDFVGGAAVADADLPRVERRAGAAGRARGHRASARSRRGRRACCSRSRARRRGAIREGRRGDAGQAGEGGRRRGRDAAPSGARRRGRRSARGARSHARAGAATGRGRAAVSLTPAAQPTPRAGRSRSARASRSRPGRGRRRCATHSTISRTAAPITSQRRLRCEACDARDLLAPDPLSSSVTHSTSIGSPRFWRWICSSR